LHLIRGLFTILLKIVSLLRSIGLGDVLVSGAHWFELLFNN